MRYGAGKVSQLFTTLVNFQTFIGPTSLLRSSISIHVMNSQNKTSEKGFDKDPPAANCVLIEDVDEFKSSLELFPRMKAKSLRQFYIKGK